MENTINKEDNKYSRNRMKKGKHTRGYELKTVNRFFQFLTEEVAITILNLFLYIFTFHLSYL